MSRRSSRLVTTGYYQADDDAASTSSTGSTGQISYRESPLRVFKKKTGGRKAASSRYASTVTSAESVGQFSEEAAGYWGPLKNSSSSSSVRSSSVDGPLPASSAFPGASSLSEVQEHSSGYSSSEEGVYGQRFGSAQPSARPEFTFSDAMHSPARAAAMLFWWLGTAWYSLTSGCSLLDVFLLSRRTAAVTKAILLFFLFLFLAFGLWYWYPYLPGFLASSAGRKAGPTLHKPNSAILQEGAAAPDLPALRNEIHGQLVEQETRWLLQKEQARQAEEKRSREDEEQRETVRREISLLRQDRQTLHQQLEVLTTELSGLKSSLKSVENEHHSRLGRETAGIDKHISDLRADVHSLYETTDLLKQKVESQQAASAKLKDELTQWLLKHLSEGRAAVVLRPELQGALESLERKLLQRLAEDREQEKQDAWRSVGEALQGEGVGAVTVQDVQQIVHRALSLYRADSIGMADYALESSGASVLNTRCSATYHTRTACVSLFGVPLWYHSESPRTVIQPDLYPGKCWAFQGSEGFLVIALSYPVHITHVTLEHLPKVLSPTGHIDSAPRDFSVYGITSETEEGTLLGKFTYDQDGEPIQTFKLPKPVEKVYRMVELRILTNWGHPEYTCVYRFRVHGKHPSK
uniref:Sad1 and UNC84 domain containing 2 n=1 Tax=Paramormyrops kingsleyae TaxID=1676925 RepID=A0A3B3RLE8_9TELE|nr:SUN domain-containing protein 2 [Paramormyrops kingsleyae]